MYPKGQKWGYSGTKDRLTIPLTAWRDRTRYYYHVRLWVPVIRLPACLSHESVGPKKRTENIQDADWNTFKENFSLKFENKYIFSADVLKCGEWKYVAYIAGILLWLDWVHLTNYPTSQHWFLCSHIHVCVLVALYRSYVAATMQSLPQWLLLQI